MAVTDTQYMILSKLSYTDIDGFNGKTLRRLCIYITALGTGPLLQAVRDNNVSFTG
ncbi:hypothetical protein Dtox_2660 [Desulfofarcimen acetoxidans DSM 771]|uniref:Uncharacterized protein n=1 Tax=Desulfofarcimen acetoxidans (strain ATCC 49208 / DSM 771 / KCTC 5769 / VKM B-1644 / 5575) TaxID=485916 RepID=C8W146_DESAS|nr:hypothetical protein Dtox_2660 [Desulfofarcimen acetoxidans DSM 771]